MIVYNRLFDLLKRRGMSSFDLLNVVSSTAVSKLTRNSVVSTATIDAVCTFLHVQPCSIMEVLEDDVCNKS